MQLVRDLKSVKESNLVWSSIIRPRQNRLLTKERMIRMYISVEDATCCLCDDQKEKSPQHLFFECGWTKRVNEELEAWSRCRMQKDQVQACLIWIKEKALPTIQEGTECKNVGGKDLSYMEG